MIDANLNRLREGIRVAEDICRFVLRDGDLALRLKNLRSLARVETNETMLAERDSENDVLRPTTANETKRDGLKSMATANFKRAQEAARALEEAFKICKPSEAETYKRIRYELYALEKAAIAKLLKR
ncbi:MAG: thiamine-phosphate pyrophosphorylase [Helicobacteraceae bacterium]|jgi:thiamine-phosphate pyrophosphorylase|nr:thiamine-phosphate pyrophosphorylase [Helicobacteraceae bacterium]